MCLFTSDMESYTVDREILDDSDLSLVPGHSILLQKALGTRAKFLGSHFTPSHIPIKILLFNFISSKLYIAFSCIWRAYSVRLAMTLFENVVVEL